MKRFFWIPFLLLLALFSATLANAYVADRLVEDWCTELDQLQNTAQAEERPAKASAQQPVQQAAPKRDSFTLEPPSFMRQQSEPAKPASNGAFAFPAFRLTPDDKDQK